MSTRYTTLSVDIRFADDEEWVLIASTDPDIQAMKDARDEAIAHARLFYQHCAHWGNVPRNYKRVEQCIRDVGAPFDDAMALLGLILKVEFGVSLCQQMRTVVTNLLAEANQELARAQYSDQVTALIQRVSPFYWQPIICEEHDELYAALDDFYHQCLKARSRLPEEPKGYFQSKQPKVWGQARQYS